MTRLEILLARLTAGFNIRDLECGMLLFTSYPALRHVSFELDQISYEATVVLKGDDKPQPLSPPTDMP